MDLALDSNGNLDIQGGQIQTVTSAPEVAQRLQIVLSVYRGEWFNDVTFGVRYFDDGAPGAMLVKNPNIPAIVDQLKTIITTTPGVDRLTSFLSSFVESARTFSVTFGVLTSDGDELTATASVGDNADSFDSEGSAGAFQLLTINGALCLD